MRRATGKYYSPVYTAKKTPAAAKRAKLIKRSIAMLVAIVATAIGITAYHINNSENNSFVEVMASQKSLEDTKTYPAVINSENPLISSDKPQNLVPLNTVPNGESVYLRRDVADSFIEMLLAMANDGLAVMPVKGYVSYDEQIEDQKNGVDKFIAEGYSSDEASEMAATKIFNPGENEAQLGTSVDVSIDTDYVSNFSSTEQYRWLCGNAQKYGFIIRYTADKESITGVEAKPWHLRYVGVEAAEYMKTQNLCLEEYVQQVINDNPKAIEEN